MEGPRPPAFWELARGVVTEARRHGLAVPAFRSPPRLGGATRTVRRYPQGEAMVSVRCKGRPTTAVIADMVEGVLLVNGLSGPTAEGWRHRLLAALGAAPG